MNALATNVSMKISVHVIFVRGSSFHILLFGKRLQVGTGSRNSPRAEIFGVAGFCSGP